MEGAAVAGAGMVSLFASYWDDAWHSDIGRDSSWIPPHLALYGSVAVAGLVVLAWGLRVLVATRSLAATLREPALLLAGAGGAGTLAAAPIDAAWHAAYGRDAVLWSAPHMLVIFASTAMIIGVLIGLRRGRSGLVEGGLCGLVLGSLLMSVMEYETDVPQFAEAYYLPVLLVAALVAAVLARGLGPRRAPVTVMVGIYAVARLATITLLAVLGRSTPDLPIAVVGLALIDLPWRTRLLRFAAGAAGVATVAWVAAAAGLSSQSPGAIAPVAVPVIAAFTVLLLGTSPRRGRVPQTAVLVVLGSVLGTAAALTAAGPAFAHDPGQGEPVVAARLSGSSDGHGRLGLAVDAGRGCEDLTPVRIEARRAGQTLAAPLQANGSCQYIGAVRVPGDGRWFVYVELRHGSQPVEAWLPLEARHASTRSETRDLYQPAGAGATRAAELGTGAVIYAAGLSLLAVALWQALRASRHRPWGGPAQGLRQDGEMSSLDVVGGQ